MAVIRGDIGIMNDVAYSQQKAIAQRRGEQRRVKGWVHMICPRATCPVFTTFVEVDEDIDRLPVQAPLKCVRCGTILEWSGWTSDPR